MRPHVAGETLVDVVVLLSAEGAKDTGGGGGEARGVDALLLLTVGPGDSEMLSEEADSPLH